MYIYEYEEMAYFFKLANELPCKILRCVMKCVCV